MGWRGTKVTSAGAVIREGFCRGNPSGRNACIWTNGPDDFARSFLNMLAEGIPVRWNDFSQSAVDGPRMLPSM